jgi:hypothetical protein
MRTARQTLMYFGVAADDFGEMQLCGGGAVGVVRKSEAYEKFLLPLARCAMIPSCYAPPLVSAAAYEQHSFDISVQSVLLHKFGYKCSTEPEYLQTDLSRCPIQPDRYFLRQPDQTSSHPDGRTGGVVLCKRDREVIQFLQSAPYAGLVIKDEQCAQRVVALQTAHAHAVSVDQLTDSPPLDSASRKQVAANPIFLYESHVSSQSVSLSVLEEKFRSGRWSHRWQKFKLGLTLFVRNPILAGLRMPVSYLLFGLLYALMIRKSYGPEWTKTHAWKLGILWIGIWTTIAISTTILSA